MRLLRLLKLYFTCEEAVEKTERCAYTGLRRSSSAASSAASRRAVQAIQKRGQTGGDDEQIVDRVRVRKMDINREEGDQRERRHVTFFAGGLGGLGLGAIGQRALGGDGGRGQDVVQHGRGAFLRLT